jgi:hypothetical protein
VRCTACGDETLVAFSKKIGEAAGIEGAARCRPT